MQARAFSPALVLALFFIGERPDYAGLHVFVHAIEQANVPVVVDAGLGAPSHAAEAMELGANAALVNTAIAVANDPNRMAVAFKMAVEAGRAAYESGLAAQSETASATSPLTAFLD